MAYNPRRSTCLKKQNGGIPTPTPEEDLLGFLPDDIKDNIATRLSIKDAVSISVVSKQWRYYWRRSLHLDFDVAIINPNKDSLVMWPSRSVTPEIYISWVSQVISSNEWQRIVSFRISHRLRDEIFFADVTRCFQFALAKKACRIIIDCGSDGRFWTDVHAHYTIPCEIFTGQAEGLLAVEQVRLACCDIQHSKLIFDSLTALTTFSLDRVLVKQQRVDDILSLCPNLKELSLRKCECIDPHLKFNTPHRKLQHLHVTSATCIVEQTEIEGLPNLASLECFIYTLKGAFLKSRPRIQMLSLLSGTAYRWIGVDFNYQILHSYFRKTDENKMAFHSYMCVHVPKDYAFPELLRLSTSLLTLLEGDEFPDGFVKFLNCLSTMSPLLLTLEIRVRFGEKALRVDRKVYQKRQHPLQSLKVLKFHNFKRRSESVDLVVFPLKNAVNLEVLKIDRRTPWYKEDGERMIEKVCPDDSSEEIEDLFYKAIDRDIDLIVI